MERVIKLLNDALDILKGCKTENECEYTEDNRVELSTIPVGGKFSTPMGNFIVLDHDEIGTKVITEELYKEDVVFGECNDYRESNVRELCEGEILDDFELTFGAENIVEHDIDLTTLDGQGIFDSIKAKVRPLVFDEARKYNEFLVNKNLPDWYWTVTAWSSEERGWKYSIAVVSPAGRVDGDCYDDGFGVRPFCILKSNILVSKED